MTDAAETFRVLTLVFTDLVDSTAMKTRHGDLTMDGMLKRHRTHVTNLAESCNGRIIDWAGDGCFLTFETSSAAVMFALQLQQAHATEADLPKVRIGIHMGEITESTSPSGVPQVKGLAVDVASRVESLAKPGQILMSASVYDNARQRLGVDSLGEPIMWRVHGSYKLKGVDSPYELSEAGIKGVAPMSAPKVGEKAKRVRAWTKDGTSRSGGPDLPVITQWFRLGGYVLIGVSLVILYFALQSRTMLDLLGFMLAAFFAGSTALTSARSIYRRHRKSDALEKLSTSYRARSRRSIRLGMGLILIGVLLSPLAGEQTRYILAMVGIPFLTSGTVLWLLLRLLANATITPSVEDEAQK